MQQLLSRYDCSWIFAVVVVVVVISQRGMSRHSLALGSSSASKRAIQLRRNRDAQRVGLVTTNVEKQKERPAEADRSFQEREKREASAEPA
jgi:hypothetical protein